jgi:UV radiation resistance-associated gene protein
LAEMRQRLQERSDRMVDLKMCTKKLSEDVEDQREQLSVKITTLTVAGRNLGAACSKLEVCNIHIQYE